LRDVFLTMDESPNFRFWWPFELTSNFGAVVSLYVLLPIATGVHTTKQQRH
jgi:hypothetical protein